MECRLATLKDAQRYLSISGDGQSVEVQEPKQGFGFCDFAIVAGQEPETTTSPDEIAQVLLESDKAASEHERNRHIETDCSGKMGAEMRQKRISASGDERTRMRWLGKPGRAGTPNRVLLESFCYLACRIVCLARNQSANAAAGLIDVSTIPRNYVHVQMEDRLPCCLPNIDANVVPVWPVRALDDHPCLLDGCEQFSALGPRRVKPGGDVSGRNQ
jgi:hypothetical protein